MCRYLWPTQPRRGWWHHHSGVGSFTSHKNQMRESAVRRDLRVFRPYPRRLELRKSNRLQMSLQRQHFLLNYLKTLSVGPAGVWTRDLPLSRPALSQLIAYKAQKPLFNESATLRYIDRRRHHENSWNTEYGQTRVTVKLTALVRSDLSLTLVLITSVRLNKAKSKYDCTNECNGSSLQM